jgi:hypothetical protein
VKLELKLEPATEAPPPLLSLLEPRKAKYSVPLVYPHPDGKECVVWNAILQQPVSLEIGIITIEDDSDDVGEDDSDGLDYAAFTGASLIFLEFFWNSWKLRCKILNLNKILLLNLTNNF